MDLIRCLMQAREIRLDDALGRQSCCSFPEPALLWFLEPSRTKLRSDEFGHHLWTESTGLQVRRTDSKNSIIL